MLFWVHTHNDGKIGSRCFIFCFQFLLLQDAQGPLGRGHLTQQPGAHDCPAASLGGWPRLPVAAGVFWSGIFEGVVVGVTSDGFG